MQPTLPLAKFKCQMSLKPISTELSAEGVAAAGLLVRSATCSFDSSNLS